MNRKFLIAGAAISKREFDAATEARDSAAAALRAASALREMTSPSYGPTPQPSSSSRRPSASRSKNFRER